MLGMWGRMASCGRLVIGQHRLKPVPPGGTDFSLCKGRLAMLAFFTTGILAAQTLTVLPPSVNLSTPESRQQLIAEATIDNHQEDWTAKVKWASSNPQVATVDEHGLVKPVSDGDAVINADNKASARVHVPNTHAPFAWNFPTNVIPVLTKSGSNSR